MFKKLGLSLIALSFVVSAQARIPQNLRIVPGSEMIVNQTREAIEDLQEIHQISFQSGMLVYFATALEEIGSDKALAANAELIAALSQLAGKEVDEDSADMMAFSETHQLYFSPAVMAFLEGEIPGSVQKGKEFGDAVRKFVGTAKALIAQANK